MGINEIYPHIVVVATMLLMASLKIGKKVLITRMNECHWHYLPLVLVSTKS
jgi:hypothetical protein